MLAAGCKWIAVAWFPRIAFFVVLSITPLMMSAEGGTNTTTVLVSAIVEVQYPPAPTPTKVIFKGLAFPNAPVTILRDGTVVAIVPADPTAHFEVEVSDVSPGTYTFSIFAKDSKDRVNRESNFTLTITNGTTTTISGIFLGPTIATDKEEVQLGDTVTVLGATIPQASVSIVVSSQTEHTFQTDADASGLWSYQFIANDLGVGTHSARAKAVSIDNEISAFSNTVSFAVVEGPPAPCDGKRPGDLNCDGRVNLTDFSILLYYWKQKHPANARADINADGIVNIQDFSIMLFWWTK